VEAQRRELTWRPGRVEVTAPADGNRVETRGIGIGLAADALVEVRDGLDAGDLVVARAGTFLREGDIVRPVQVEPAIS
jgi:hypothetical protein